MMAKLKGAAKAKFLARMNKGRVKAGLKRIGSKTKAAVKRRTPKRRKSAKRKTKTTKSRSSNKRTVAGKKGGTKGMTRVKKFLLGLGIGAGVSTVAGLTRVREIEGIAPIIDAAVGGGVEAQIGTAIPRLIRQVLPRIGFNGNGSNGMALEGA